MQSLALDVNVVSEEGQRAEMRDEDDDLLRAAEELGIDLSGVRAAAGDASDEALEGEDTTDASAESQEDAEAAPDLDEVGVTEDVDLENLVGEEAPE
jgi:DNA-directed RNA polymerase subunit beta